MDTSSIASGRLLYVLIALLSVSSQEKFFVCARQSDDARGDILNWRDQYREQQELRRRRRILEVGADSQTHTTASLEESIRTSEADATQESSKMHSWVRCTGSASAYAAAWFAEATTVHDTRWGNTLGMEFHDFNIFNQGGNTRPRVGLKAKEPKQFWVDHLSMYEHKLRRDGKSSDQVDAMVQAVAEGHIVTKCGIINRTNPNGIAGKLGHQIRRFSPSIVALVPYYGGSIENTKGNAHSKVSRKTKRLQLHATVCAIRAELSRAASSHAAARAGGRGGSGGLSVAHDRRSSDDVMHSPAVADVRVAIGVCNSVDYTDVIAQLGSPSNDNPLLWKVQRYACGEDPYLAPTLLRDFQTKFAARAESNRSSISDGHQRTPSWHPDFVYFTEQDQVLTLSSDLGIGGLISGVGIHSYVIPNRYEIGALKNNCGNGEHLLTSLSAHVIVNAGNRIPNLQSQHFSLKGTGDSTPALPASAMATEDATTLQRNAYVRCWAEDEIMARAFLITASTFRSIRPDQMKARNVNTPYHIAISSGKPYRAVIRPVDPSIFTALDYSIAADKAIRSNPASAASGASSSFALPVHHKDKRGKRRRRSDTVDTSDSDDRSTKSLEQRRRLRDYSAQVATKQPHKRVETGTLKPPEICRVLNLQNHHHEHRGERNPHAQPNEKQHRKRRRDVLAILPLDAFASATDAHRTTPDSAMRNMASTRGAVVRQCAGICSILSYVRFIGVGFCRQGADHATTIGGAPAWFRMSGLAHYTFDSTALECPHPYDVTRLTLEYFQNQIKSATKAKASKHKHGKEGSDVSPATTVITSRRMQVYSGIYYVLYCPPDLILRIKPNIASFQAFDESSNTSSSVAALTPFDSLLRAVKPRVILAPHVIKMHEQVAEQKNRADSSTLSSLSPSPSPSLSDFWFTATVDPSRIANQVDKSMYTWTGRARTEVGDSGNIDFISGILFGHGIEDDQSNASGSSIVDFHFPPPPLTTMPPKWLGSCDTPNRDILLLTDFDKSQVESPHQRGARADREAEDAAGPFLLVPRLSPAGRRQYYG